MVMINAFPGASEAEFEHFKNELGFEFPAELKEHYRKYDGGGPDPANFLFQGEYYCLNEFFPFGDFEYHTDILKAYKWWAIEDNFIRRTDIPFGSAPGGDLFLYSVEEVTYGKIFFAVGADYGSGDHIFKLADSFAELMGNLVLHPDDEVQ
jgi:SMI1 / KNR4 family (SUKH-1)